MKTRFKIRFLLPVLLIPVGPELTGSLAAQASTTLYSFKGREGGSSPTGFLILSDNTLYGTAGGGGTADKGSVFALKTDGTGFTNLHSFIVSDGANPSGGMILAGNTLYGTTSGGGRFRNGTVFRINIDGSGFTNLYSFGAGSGSYPNITNSDGVGPSGKLALSGDRLYGTASYGGNSAIGTLFALNMNGTGFTNLHSFSADEGKYPGGLILSGNRLYGTTHYGTNHDGTVFRPFGTRHGSALFPHVKTWGYSQMSLRDRLVEPLPRV